MTDFNPRPAARSAAVAHVITTARPPGRPRRLGGRALASALWALAAAFAGVPVCAWWRARAAVTRQAWREYRASAGGAR